MASITDFMAKVDMTKFLVIAISIVLVTVGGLVAIYMLTDRDYAKIEDSSPYRDAQVQMEGVQKADSDVRTLLEDGESVTRPWPDKLSDIEENYIYGTNWNKPDSDGDGMEDGWEALYSRPNPITERLTIDPNENDWYGNPDGDGFDMNNNGVIDEAEALFNLREYCGGAEFVFNVSAPDEGTFADDGSVFSNLNPLQDWQEIGMLGGFHLYDDPDDGLVDFEGDLDDSKFDDYMRYNPYLPQIYRPVTTNPSLWDTDMDGIDDGWETHYHKEMADIFFSDGRSQVFEGSISSDDLEVDQGDRLVQYETREGDVLDFTPNLIDPLNPQDGDYDLDVRSGFISEGGAKKEVLIFEDDGLSNVMEYENHTSPLLWDTDGDSYFNPLEGRFFQLDDYIELQINYTQSSVDWNGNGILNYRTCPYMSDTDGDDMADGWELESGLNPLNSTDRFKDLDGDGLPNYLENAFPSKEERWFQTNPLKRDTDGDGMWDGWEAYNAKIISREREDNNERDLVDMMRDFFVTIYTVSPMIPDAELDNDGYWNISGGFETYSRQPDGLTNIEEFRGTAQFPISTDPNDPDTDGDGLTDGDELKLGFHGELIGDNYFTERDYSKIYYTNATLADSDNDYGGSDDIRQVGNVSRRLDDWEETHGETKYTLPPNGFDDDGDGEIDESEGEKLIFDKTNATNPDSDLDGWMDVDELFGIDTRLLWERSKMGIVRTDPNKKDTDNDQMSDYDELHRIPNYREWITDPNDPDTDNDQMEDGLENDVDFFPLIDYDRGDNYDANGDGDYSDEDLGDVWSNKDRCNPTKADTDGDSLPDGWEYIKGKVVKSDQTKSMILWYDRIYGTNYWNLLPEGGFFWIVNPLVGSDLYDDPDQDDLTNLQEYENGTHPLLWDTDGDGMPDGWELRDDIRGSYLLNPETSRYEYILDPLDPTDWALDADHDGYVYSIWTPTNSGQTQFELVYYYFPWINLYEYQFGIDTDGDGINEITTTPAPQNENVGQKGGWDSDNDGMPDGWEVWVSDGISNVSNPQQYEDNDSLPKGWEDLYNGSAWNRPECYIYEDENGTWEPWANSVTIDRRTFAPEGLLKNRDYYVGKLYSDRKDTNRNGVPDSGENDDSDTYSGGTASNYIEYRAHTDPTNKNSHPERGNIPSISTGPTRKMITPGPVDLVITLPMDIPEVEQRMEFEVELTELLDLQRIMPSEVKVDVQFGKDI